MRTVRIYLPDTLAAHIGHPFTLTPEASHHIATVLRMKPGMSIVLFCGDGFDYTAEILVAEKRKTTVKILSQSPNKSESKLKIHLAQALSRGDKMDYIVQKAVELGVTEITPLICDRTQGSRDATKLAKKQEHLKKVIISACEQSGRCVLPTLNPAIKSSAFLTQEHQGAKIILHPEQDTTPTSCAYGDDNITDFTLAIGPDGGFSDDEITCAYANGFMLKVLGPRILRTETAGLAFISVLQYAFGDFTQ